jgi:rubrerythrin
MVDESDEMLKALQAVMEIEQDIMHYYLDAVKSIENSSARELILVLAEEEKVHRNNVAIIHKSLRDNKPWPDMSGKQVSRRKFKDLLNTTCRAIGVDGASNAIPAHILETAIEKEEKSYNIYNEKARCSSFESEKSFYTALALEERDHFLTLVDFKQYVDNPEGWFSEHESWTMDG